MPEFNYECKATTVCNDNSIFPAMRELIEDRGMNPHQASKFIEEDSDGKISAKRAEGVWQRRNSTRVESKPNQNRFWKSVGDKLNKLSDTISEKAEFPIRVNPEIEQDLRTAVDRFNQILEELKG
jgi:hypothetical protein